jgi:hypothetical protein
MIERLVRKLEKESTFIFILKIAAVGFVLKGIVGGLTDSIFSYLGWDVYFFGDLDIQIPEISIADFFLLIAFAPLVETAVGQWIPISIARRFGWSERKQVIISALVFMVLHYPVLVFFPSAYLLGLFLGWAWLLKEKKGKKEAFLVTSAIHALHNLMAFSLTAVSLFFI